MSQYHQDHFQYPPFACIDDDCPASNLCEENGCASDAVPCDDEACYSTDPCLNEACYSGPDICIDETCLDEACVGANRPCTDVNCTAFAGLSSPTFHHADDPHGFSHMPGDALQFFSALNSMDAIHDTFHTENFNNTQLSPSSWHYTQHLALHHPSDHELALHHASTYGMGPTMSATPGSLPGTPMTTFSLTQSMSATPGSLSSMECAPTVTAAPTAGSIPPHSASSSAAFMLPPSTFPTPISRKSSSTPAAEPPFICQWEDKSTGLLCAEHFKDEQALHTHCKEHHLQRLAKIDTGFYCQWHGCVRANHFGQKSKLERHLQTHTGYKPVKCTVCGTSLSAKQSLEQHMRTHTGEKPWICNFKNCGQAFKQQSALTMHQRTHTGDKPLVCEICGKRFGESSNLSKHRKIHNQKGSFSCQYCGKSFHRQDQKRRHERTHLPKTEEGTINMMDILSV
ncbi:Zinc-responsive transcriptional regulator ZAP1 [Paramyrothecium foliicola]|nr:Zinc-responsive transcriptional regulator ZAP1 [Paramyrothecium foliicola]